MHLTARERLHIRLEPIARISHVKQRKQGEALAEQRLANAEAERQKGKGQLHGKCNVTACDERGSNVRWWNRPMRAYYCGRCRIRINDADDYLGTEHAIFDTRPHPLDSTPDSAA